MFQIEPQIKKVVRASLDSLSFSCPAKVLSIRNIKDGVIDVKPLTNKVMFDYDDMERSAIHDVPIVSPSTITSVIQFPVNEGDTVLLVFNGDDIEEFKGGNREPHTPRNFGTLQPSSAVALLGFNTKLDSIYDNGNYTNDIDNTNLNIIHNVGESNEVVISLTSEGEVKIKSDKVIVETKEADITADTVTVDATLVDAKNSLVKTNNDVEIKGKSVYQFMTIHDHPYTDNGSPMTTSPPNPL
ncbi:MAG: hypothetical protein KBT03_07135 [Bacteroidales bacterium]|nr:hypothetical protein [Candidatus Scybalousia scybalohippi]